MAVPSNLKNTAKAFDGAGRRYFNDLPNWLLPLIVLIIFLVAAGRSLWRDNREYQKSTVVTTKANCDSIVNILQRQNAATQRFYENELSDIKKTNDRVLEKLLKQ